MADPSYNYSFTPYNNEHREKNLFIEEYYSSTDTKIYFDDEEQTQIGYIQYELQEQLKPVFGYNSRTWDDVIIGNRIVTGTFTMPIQNKEKQKFDASDILVDKYNPNATDNTSEIEQYNREQEQGLYDIEWFGDTKRYAENNHNNNINTEILISLIALGYNVSPNSSTQEYQKSIKEFQNDYLGPASATGVLNTLTVQKIQEAVRNLSNKGISLTGATGYYDMQLKTGGVVLSGNGFLLDTINNGSNTIYHIVDSQGRKFYITGILGGA